MSIQDWGAIGEIIGALAVVASLIYLAVQIRQNTRQISLSMDSAKLAAFERNVESGNRMREILILNPEVAELFISAMADYQSLSVTQKLRCDMLFRNMFSTLQGGYIRQLTVGGDPSGFEGPREVVDALLGSPGIRDWLNENSPDWRPEFTEFVLSRLARIQARADEADAEQPSN